VIPWRDRARRSPNGPCPCARWEAVGTKGERSIDAALLARHWRQLRTSHGTVLLGEPAGKRDALRLDPAWFVTGCPLAPEDALEALRTRHGFTSRSLALRALRKAQGELRAARHADAAALDDLPPEPRRG
jgi:hypothetical protein